MSHFAKVINGVVTEVIVIEQAMLNTGLFGNASAFIQTSYNTRGNVHYAPNSETPDDGIPLRGNYASIGYIYDSTHDVFYPPSPYPSWTINTSTWTWQPPTPSPTSGNYAWNEATLSWVAWT
jgi:hypothetical protein